MKKILVAMSGGVDSAVTALLLKKAGYDLVGCTMALHGKEDGLYDGSCGSLDDLQDARRVADTLGIEHRVYDLSKDFRQCVIEPFAAAYMRGQTPNPCIDCNRHMKFGALHRLAASLGCDGIATGHYARIVEQNGTFLLQKAVDGSKDQSYVLYHLTKEQLKKTLFPLGEMSKTEVRRIAEENGFCNAQKPDSQDICFVPDGDYAATLERITGTPSLAGDFVDKDGRVLGRHRGIAHYTVGQRKGLGIAFGEPMFVTRICAENNTVCLGRAEDLLGLTLCARDVNWTADVPQTPFRCQAKIRYRKEAEPALVTPTDEGFSLVFDAPQRAITPGQAVVLYDGDTVLGGGKIVGL